MDLCMTGKEWISDKRLYAPSSCWVPAYTPNHQDEKIRRHTSHTTTAPSTHSPNKMLVPIRQPRINDRK